MPDSDDRRVGAIKRQHFENIAPLCPVCRQQDRNSHLEIGSETKGTDDSVLEGILVCTHPQCRSEYPIIDGIPILVADLRNYISQNIVPILCRRDLGDTMESLLGDCFGPGSAFDALRQHVGTYAFDHYGGLDPQPEDFPVGKPGSILELLKTGMQAMGEFPGGHIIDMGCSVGRTTFALGEKSDGLVLGVDLNFGMLRTAAAILNRGRVSYPVRRCGIIYERRDFPVSFGKMENVDFWACDATALPFSDAAFSTALSLNLLDCVAAPYAHLTELARMLTPGGKAILSTPYDWSANATAVEAWLGGHSQRGDTDRAADSVLRSMLADGGHPGAVEALEPTFEKTVPWRLRLHDRSIMEYRVHLMGLLKSSGK